MASAFLTFVSAVLLLAASLFAIREAWAELLWRTGARTSAEAAIRMSSHNAQYHVTLSELLDREGSDGFDTLNAAAALRPTDDSIWIRLGLRQESAGRAEEAEEYLLKAARVSRKYVPRWTLANFYYRRQLREPFWHWAREALRMSYGDRTPLFQLCWDMAPKAELILERGIPERRPVRMDFATFLLARESFSAAEVVLGPLAADAHSEELPYFLGKVDELIAAGRVSSSVEIWNSLCSHGLIPFAALNPGNGTVVTNAEFARPSLERGFDWRMTGITGVFLAQYALGQGWVVTFSGRQPERCELLRQTVPLPGFGAMRLRFRYQSSLRSLNEGRSGLRWTIRKANGERIAASEDFVSKGTHEGALEFRPGDAGLGLLVLEYERPGGSSRIEGTVLLESARMELAE